MPDSLIKTMTNKLILPLLLAAATCAQAGDWLEFRGPSGDGHSLAKNVPLKWGPDQNIAWRQELPGNGWSSPVLHNDRLYLSAAVPQDDNTPPSLSLHVLCLDAKSGKVVWNKELFRHGPDRTKKQHKKNSYASPTPVIKDGRIYAHFSHMGTACLDLTGKVLWKNDSLDYSPVHGTGGSPIIVGDILFFSCDAGKNAFVAALNKNTGKLAWKKQRNIEVDRPFSFSTPTAIKVNGQTQIISPASGAVIAYNPKNGEEIWKVRYGQGYSVVPKPIYAHGLVYVCSGFNKAVLHAIDPNGQGDITDTHVKWTYDKDVPKSASILIVGDTVFMTADRNYATCLDAKTGKVHYRERVEGGYSASPTFAEGRIYITNENGKTTVLAPGRKFKVLGENDLAEKTLASFAVTDGTIFLRTESALYRVGK